MRVGGKMQPTPRALLLANEIAPILRSLRRALEPAEAFDPATTNRVFSIALHSEPAFIANVTVTSQIGEVAPGAMVERVRIEPTNQNDLIDGQIDLLHMGDPAHLADGIHPVDLAPVPFLSFVRQGHPAARNSSADTASQYRYLHGAVEGTVSCSTGATRNGCVIAGTPTSRRNSRP